MQENSGDPKTALGQGVDMLKGGGGIFKSAAVTVLRQDRRLLTTAEITKCALHQSALSDTSTTLHKPSPSTALHRLHPVLASGNGILVETPCLEEAT